jgi:two-component SAPR family response regulator
MTQRIMALDDDPNILRLIKKVLEPAFEVTTFDTPHEVLAALHKGFKPDLILCDITMPDMTGFELHEAVRDLVPLRSVPFVYLTALTEREYQRKGMLLGADDYLTKPFRPKELIEAVETRLERAHTLQETVVGDVVVHSLGGFGVLLDGRPLHWEAAKVSEAFLYLASQEKVSTQRFRADLWREPVGDNNLYVLYTRLRKVIEPFAVFTVKRGELSLEVKGAFTWDVPTFEKSAQKAIREQSYVQLEHAVGLYGGVFLPGMDSPWAESERSRLEVLYMTLLELSPTLAPTPALVRAAEQRLANFNR